MKKAMVYILALTLALSAFLTGCGELRGTDGNSAVPAQTTEPTLMPDMMTPDPEDGIVRDGDGFITEEDSGNEITERTIMPKTTGKPTGSQERQSAGSTVAGSKTDMR